MANLGNVNGNVAQGAANTGVKKIYIGNINYELDTPDLIEMFSEFGEVIDAVVIKDKETRASRGFGFVTYTRSDSATAAVSKMHGHQIGGRALRVKFAEAKRREANETYNSSEQQPFNNNNNAYSQQPPLMYQEYNHEVSD